jgi:hypothetical protein
MQNRTPSKQRTYVLNPLSQPLQSPSFTPTHQLQPSNHPNAIALKAKRKRLTLRCRASYYF